MNKAIGFPLLLLSAVVLQACGTPEDTVLRDEQNLVQSAGEIAADVQLSVAPPVVDDIWQYTIKDMAAERALVNKGDVLVQFDDEQIRQNIAKKTAELNNARQELTNRQQADAKQQQDLRIAKAEKQMLAEKDQRKASIVDHSRSALERKKMQIDAQISANDLALASLKLDKSMQQALSMQKMLESKVSRLATELAKLQADQQKMSVLAPFSGVVSYQENFSNEKFAVGDKVQFGQPVLELNQLDSLYVSAAIDEVYLARLQTGTPAQIRVDSLPDAVLTGQLRPLETAVRDKSYNDQRRVFDVKINLDQAPPEKLRPGMTARLQFGNKPERQSAATATAATAATTANNNAGSQP